MIPDSFNLSNKIALVTGASRGIGESIATTLAQYGAHVILVSRKIESIEAVANQIKEAGFKATPMACHTGDLEQISALFDQIEKEFGGLDILVNNAATNPYFGPVLEAPVSAWDKTLEVNLKGPFFISQQAAKLMKARGGGSIVNVASINGLKPPEGQGIYSITKAGVIAMTQSFARELGRYQIRVNALVPGLTETKFASALIDNDQILKPILRETPLARVGQPSEMANAVLYLVAPASSFTTGICLRVDGGLLS